MKFKRYRVVILFFLFLTAIYLAYLFINNRFIMGMPYFSTSYKESKDKGVFISFLHTGDTKYRLPFQPWIEKTWYKQTSILGTTVIKHRQNEYNLLYPYCAYKSGNQYDLQYYGDSRRGAGSDKDSVQLSALTEIPDSIKLFVEHEGKIIDSFYLQVKGVAEK